MLYKIIIAFLLLFFLPIINLYAEEPGYEKAPWEVEVNPGSPKKKSEYHGSTPGEITTTTVVNVTVYIENFCDECKKVTEFLRNRNVNFNESYFDFNIGTIFGTATGRAPLTRIDYSDGTYRQIRGADFVILNALFPLANSNNPPPQDWDSKK